ncbi:MAG: hypothetical protein QOJ09_1785, partial [Actinomycetota bacterium]|nr:hypothetical protein [Actinomycetota bacterium]
NHLIRNLKALVGLGVFLGRPRVQTRAMARLATEVRRQVLDDGGHYERSPSYHVQVLIDVTDVAALVAAQEGSAPRWLTDAQASMRSWLGHMRLPDGGIPLFNDCQPVAAAVIDLLAPGPPAPEGLTLLEPSGYAILRSGARLHVVADVGLPCPDELPAHAHADCLSFVLCVDGVPVIVDTGTSTYEPGVQRQHERSTRAHNTVEVDGADQTEVFGTFRAGRRARPTIHAVDPDPRAPGLTASHDGYRRLAGDVTHRRRWRLHTDALEIADVVEGAGHHRVTSILRFAPSVQVAKSDAGWKAGPLEIDVTAAPVDPNADAWAPGTTPDAWVAERFGVLRPAAVLEATVNHDLPIAITTVLRLGSPTIEP